MTRRVTREKLIVVLALGAAASLLALALPGPAAALPDYTTKTGQACAVCHTTATGGPLTARGQAFAAVANHATDPAGAFAASAAPAPTPPPVVATPPPATPPTTAAPRAATPAPTAPSSTGTTAPTTLPRTGGMPLPLLPAALLGAVALCAGIYARRR